MGMMVQYKDKKYGYVSDEEVADLIESGLIIAFRQNDVWIEIGKDKCTRADALHNYHEHRRRMDSNRTNCITCSNLIDNICNDTACPLRISTQAKHMK